MSSQLAPLRSQDEALETDFLIAGAGVAGGSLACFLADYGFKGLVISAAQGPARQPRAHITNQGALDALRDIGLSEECARHAYSGRYLSNYRWSESMAGEEYGRVWSWGYDPKRMGEYAAASPNKHLEFPQSKLEPMLVKFATDRAFTVRFDTELLRFEELKQDKIRCFLKDKITGVEYQVLTKYLFGADGGRSVVAKQLKLDFDSKSPGGFAWNLIVKGDLAHLMKSRPGNLHWTLRVDISQYMACWRLVEAWDKWLVAILPSPSADPLEPTQENFMKILKDTLGDDSVDMEIIDVGGWQINEVIAKKYSRGNMSVLGTFRREIANWYRFCLGDACHRHPPCNGLGSNTCIQDSFNLAWKINLVHKGLASPKLLETYNQERQPVGAQVVEVANISLRMHFNIWEAIGLVASDKESREAARKELKSVSAAGRQRRKRLRTAVDSMAHETLALGVEMGQRYKSSAVFSADEPEQFQPSGKEAENAVLYYEPCTYPGRRLPHVWLNKAAPHGKDISTIDLAGKGAFCLITGWGGQLWIEAAAKVSKELDVGINAVSIGWRLDWEDINGDWERVRGVEEDGAILVRPDLFVAWRAQTLPEEKDCVSKLKTVMRSLLSL